jgi:PTH1 family peptidyl-tRNA hydrolase
VTKSTVFLIVGLGNPEGKYFKTYHNIGFVVVEEIAKKFGVEFKKVGNQMLCKCGAFPPTPPLNAGQPFLLLKPLTYMNLSGQAVVAAARKHKILAENIVVVCDDLHIEKGNIRIACRGSAGGHNGLKSIIDLLATNEFKRVRVGIQPATERVVTQADYVLSKIDGPSQPLIDNAVDKAVAAVISIVSGEKIEAIMGRYNVKNNQ